MRIRRWGRRIAALLMALSLLLLTGCRSSAPEESEPETTYITTTFYPLYALAVNIMKDVPDLSLSCLVQPQDGCIRSYELSDWDYSILLHQDAIIEGGCGLESFSSVLTELSNQPIVMSVLDGVHLTEDNAGNADDENTSHFMGENPWAFMAVERAMEICIGLAGGMSEVDEPYTEIYHANLQDYLQRLEDLIEEMARTVARAPQKPVAVLHEGLTYFAAQFNLEIACIYPREPGSGAYENDLIALLETLEASGAEVVFLEEQAPDSLVRSLEEAGYPVARIDTLTAHRADGDPEAYERIMLENAQAAYDALMRTK